MPIDRRAALERLRRFDFPGLFTQELGWDWFTRAEEITKDGQIFRLAGVAEKRGVQVFHCLPDADGRIPLSTMRSVLERELTKRAREHLLIFTDAARSEQLWLYTRREPGRPIRQIPYRFDPARSNELLIQKLSQITFTLNEEESLTLVGVVRRLKDTLDRDEVTKAFYQRFDLERRAFQRFLKGIPDEKLQRWYVAVLLNRLMFIYFIQQKGFLGDGDQNYLQNRLAACRGNYYRDFLCPLFFQGFALRAEDRPDEVRALLGQVSYLNGGIFQRHQIEELHGRTIEIDNEAFRAIFAFFDRYRWHLDERPLASGDEIDPSILGYIFEKYINAIQPGEQKAKGAYYTKEDITGYISRNTVIPFLFDAARKEHKPAFEGEPSVWRLLRADPDSYIYKAVRHGVSCDIHTGQPLARTLALPPEIAAGLNDVSKRGNWNKPAPGNFALPTETWREVVARRTRCEEIRAKLAAGEVRDSNELITLNLDIQQFAQDVIENCDAPETLRAFWHAIAGTATSRGVAILDPTCGSGAFLFAALNVLEPLYEACLKRMEEFLEDEAAKLDKTKLKSTEHGYPLLPHKKLEDFSLLLDRVAARSSRYFIFKSIILNNLFGVDIMEEAVEICKLRLFLKLAAQVELDASKDNLGIEPLPDIDFNIRAGNTLVGYATTDEVKTAAQTRLSFGIRFEQIQESAEKVDRLFKLFHELQEKEDMPPAEFRDAKARLKSELEQLAQKLDAFLASDYSRSPSDPASYRVWDKSHQPFHWFVEFYGIISKGGFDVIIGNPPYVEYKDVKSTYTVRDYDTVPCGDLYAFCTERALNLLRHGGLVGLIVPISIYGTDGFEPLQKATLAALDRLWVSCFANRPSQLFDGAQKRLTILIGRRHPSKNPCVYTTRYFRWKSEEFDTLFRSRIQYAPPHPNFTVFPASLEKLGSPDEVAAFRRLTSVREKLAGAASDLAGQRVYYTRKFGYFLAFTDFVPEIIEIRTGRRVLPSELKELGFGSPDSANAVVAALTSSTFFWFWNVLSDCRNLNRRDLLAFPFDPERIPAPVKRQLSDLGQRYLAQLKKSSRTMLKSGLRIETFEYASCKSIVDEIDRVLAKHYGFTSEELDFILNYDIKYRLGLVGEEDED